jgi:hypothetical protein
MAYPCRHNSTFKVKPYAVRRRRTASLKAVSTSARSKLVHKADELVGLIVRTQEPYCVTCGTTEDLQCGHLYSRRAHSTRFDLHPEGNCHTQCGRCNLRHVTNKFPYINWYLKNFGEDALVRLHARWCEVKKYSCDELKSLIALLRIRLLEVRKAAA